MGSDGGVLPLREIDHRLGLLSKVLSCLPDPRDQICIQHKTLAMLHQRVCGIDLVYESLKDHEHLRHNITFQTDVQKDAILASNVSLC